MSTTILSDPSDNGKGLLGTEQVAAVNRLSGVLPDEAAAFDPFDPANLRLPQNFADGLGVRKVLTTVSARKPNRQEFFRVRAGELWRVETGIYEDKINRDCYLVAPALWSELLGEVVPVCIFLAITKQNDVFLWPCKLPGADGRSNAWNDSAIAAARLAETRWVRLAANMAAGHYDVYEAAGELAEPTWPEISLRDLLELCFKDRRITSVDHPAIKALRGLA